MYKAGGRRCGLDAADLKGEPFSLFTSALRDVADDAGRRPVRFATPCAWIYDSSPLPFAAAPPTGFAFSVGIVC